MTRMLTASVLGLVLLAGCSAGAGRTESSVRKPPPAAAPASTPAPRPCVATTLSAWRNGTGRQELQVVENALVKTSRDDPRQDPAIAQADGGVLARGARSAASCPPPVGMKVYRAAMANLAQAGEEITQGRYAAAEARLRTGKSQLRQAAAALGLPSP